MSGGGGASSGAALTPPHTPLDERGARFFAGGRRISACGATPSFVKESRNRWTVWANPQVVGYIDIRSNNKESRGAGPLQPVITRDEFKNTRGRKAAYAALIHAVEEPLLEAIDAANRQTSEKSLVKLESVLTQVSGWCREDYTLLRLPYDFP